MKVRMSDAGVPMVISYRKILRKPKIVRERKYVGVLQTFKNLLAKAIELVEDTAFETKVEVLDEGQSVSIHWAISVEDPWDTTTGVEKNLIAYRMLNDIPPSGVHFEVISPMREEQPQPEPSESIEESQDGPAFDPNQLTPEQFTQLSREREQEALLAGTRGPNGKFRQPPAPQYTERRIKTIDEEIAEEKAPDADAAHLDGASRLGKDN